MHSQAKKCRKPGFSPHPSRIPPAGSLCQRPPRRMPQGFPGARGLRPALSPGHTVSLQRYGSHWGWTRGSPRARGHAAAAALPAQCPRSSHRPASPAGAGSPCLSRARDRKVLPRCSGTCWCHLRVGCCSHRCLWPPQEPLGMLSLPSGTLSHCTWGGVLAGGRARPAASGPLPPALPRSPRWPGRGLASPRLPDTRRAWARPALLQGVPRARLPRAEKGV